MLHIYEQDYKYGTDLVFSTTVMKHFDLRSI